MAIDPAAVQAVATGVFGALSALFYRKMAKSRKEINEGVTTLNGHAEEKKIIRRRLLAHSVRFLENSRRLRKLEESQKDLIARVEALEARRT